MTAIAFDPDDARFAAHYDELPLWSAPFAQLILDRVPLRAGQVSLDVGSGTGFLSIELAQRCGPGSRVYAVDPWTRAQDVLRAKLDFLGLDSVVPVVRDAVATGLPDGHVDVVVSNLGINNMADPPAVLAECRRVLHPGGRLLLASNTAGHMREFYDVLLDTVRAVGRNDRVPAVTGEIEHRIDADGLSGLVTTAGFRVTDIVRSSFVWRYADSAALLGHWFVRLGFLDGWLSAIGDDGRDKILAELGRRLDAAAARDGDLRLTIPMVCLDAVRG